MATHDINGQLDIGVFFVVRPYFVGSVDDHGEDGCLAFSGDEFKAVFEGLEVSIECSLAFGEEDDDSILYKSSDGDANGRGPWIFLIDGEGVDGSQEASEHWVIEEAFFSHEVTLSIEEHSAQKGIEITLMVADQ